MTIDGNFADFSFNEILDFLEFGKKKGLLTIKSKTNHFFWINKGCVVAASNRTDGLGLYKLILELSLIRKRSLKRVIDSAYHPSKPLGLFLHENGFLSWDVLKVLFKCQLTRELYLLECNPGLCFSFDKDAVIPNIELTGLSLPLHYLLCPNLGGSDSLLNHFSTKQIKKKLARLPMRNSVLSKGTSAKGSVLGNRENYFTA